MNFGYVIRLRKTTFSLSQTYEGVFFESLSLRITCAVGLGGLCCGKHLTLSDALEMA